MRHRVFHATARAALRACHYTHGSPHRLSHPSFGTFSLCGVGLFKVLSAVDEIHHVLTLSSSIHLPWSAAVRARWVGLAEQPAGAVHFSLHQIQPGSCVPSPSKKASTHLCLDHGFAGIIVLHHAHSPSPPPLESSS